MSRPARRLIVEREELVSLVERMRWLTALRIGTGLAVLGVAVFVPEASRVSLVGHVASTVGYLSAVAISASIGWRLAGAPVRGRRAVLAMVAVMLLIDGLFLGWARYSAGALTGPLAFPIYVHILAVTIVASYRTGFKIAAWHSLLLFVALYAQAAGALAVTDPVATLPGGEAFWPLSLLNVGALWAVALVAAAFSSINERELRGHKRDLAALSSAVRRIDGGRDVRDVSRILLEELREAFGFDEGVVLSRREQDLEVLAASPKRAVPGRLDGVDPFLDRIAREGELRLVKRIDPQDAPLVAAVLPKAENVLVAPICDSSDECTGFAILHRDRPEALKRWTVSLIDQYLSHAALAMRNRGLLEEVERSLDENRSLQNLLAMQNEELEETVDERTRELRATMQELVVAGDERRRLLARLVDAQESERQRVANDIHDDPLQKLAAISMQLQLARRDAGPDAARAFDSMTATIKATITSMRRMIFDLRPSILDEVGIASALREYLQTRCADLDFELVDRLGEEPPEDLRVVLFRVTQEALANVLKHAGASRVRVLLADQDDGVVARIEDDGVGFDPPEMLRSAPGHLGLSSMRERAEMVGGWCRVQSLANCGTSVELWVPREGKVAGVGGDGSSQIPASGTTIELGPDDDREALEAALHVT